MTRPVLPPLRPIVGRWLATAAILAVACLVAPWGQAGAQEEKVEKAAPAVERAGSTIRITLPINRKTADRVERFVERSLRRAVEEHARPVLIFQFETPDDQGKDFAGQTKFSDAYGLAGYLTSRDLNQALTVAYIPKSLTGHAVLVALACDEIFMAPEAVLGPIAAEPGSVGSTERSAYKEIANRRKTVPAEVALWLLDPTYTVYQVQTEISTEYVDANGLDELAEKRTIQSKTPLTELVGGQPGELTGQEARKLGFVAALARSRDDVANMLDLPAKAIQEDPSMFADWRPIRVDLKGPIDGEKVSQAQRIIEEEVRVNEANFVCLWIDSPGGSPADSIVFAEVLRALDPGRVRTVAYIPNQALSDAALIALACDDVVMHPAAELGGSGAYALSRDDVKYAVEAIRAPNSPWQHRSWSLVAAMVDPDLEVFECSQLSQTAYFCEEELEQRNAELAVLDPKAPRWQKGQQVTTPGQPFQVDGERAVADGLAAATVESFTEFRDLYNVKDDLKPLEPSWADVLVDALASPGAAALLLTIAFVALYFELNVPGIGVGGFVATICFLLFFWAHYLGGTAGWLEIILFLSGISCLLLEVFVLPGFGVFGLGGGFLVLASLILASQTFVLPRNAYQLAQLQQSLLGMAGAALGIVLAGILLRHWLPKAPIINRMYLAPPEGEEAQVIARRESLVYLDELVGQRGTTTTQLTPSGKARFGDVLIDVISDGEVVARGTPIEVVEVHGNRVLVRTV